MSVSPRDRLLAPARIAAKQVRHSGRRARRAAKQLREAARGATSLLWRSLVADSHDVASWVTELGSAVHRLASERRDCPACGSRRIRLIEPIRLYRTVEKSRTGFVAGCRSCGLLFVNPPPDAEALEEFYSPEGTWGVSHAELRRETLERQASRALAGFRKPNPRRRPRDFVLDALQAYAPILDPPPGAAVLDFGCGDGKLLNVLFDAGWRTYGIEPSTDVAFLRHERLERVPRTPTFDLIVLHHVLEHLPEPFAILQDLSAALRPGGILFISVPRLDTLPEHRDFRYCLNARTHLVSFSEACLRELLARAGLETAGVLDDPELDAQITEGVPLRLRLVARKGSGHPARVPNPLRAALTALDGYRAQAPRHWLDRLLPVRVRAYLMEREQRRRRTLRADAA